ncbi:orotidine-5'-phosphate decarboxylase [Patescibacteria group bacterium]|nr:MAG: orotidine-5'-phosphate decarboxylase [Patescibacteria group bacterium]
MTSFFDKLNISIDQNNSLLCVGLDPVIDKLPKHLRTSQTPLFDFNKAIIDATAEFACAFKPNSAFYEALGPSGIEQLKQTVDYINQNYPNIPTILDAKRADIGSTNEGYTEYVYDYLQMDAITLHPYLGSEALEPFLAYKDKGQIILCRTSNPGAGEFQDLLLDGAPLYEHVAEKVRDKWNGNNNCLLVVGATYPSEMKKIREIVGPNMIFLVPGVGAQGGNIEETMEAGLGLNSRGLIISSSRDIIYAGSDEDFAQASALRAKETRDEINKYR